MSNALILDGKSLARSIELSLKERVNAFNLRTGKTPLLATILVGSDPASATYVKMKGNACARVECSPKDRTARFNHHRRAAFQIQELNEDPQVNGILLQHPVPKQINERLAFDAISLDKDVDGVTCLGFGRMAMGEQAYGSATPAGIMKILDHYNISLEGKHAVVVGRSPILGKPMALMLLNRNATVTICHSKTKDLPSIIKEADMLVGAVGKPKFIQGNWLKQGAVVIDAGYHPGNVGDIDLEAAIPNCSAYTPVPGGVGPMTIASLICQTMESAEKSI